MDELSRWMALCSRREYCSADILEKLSRKGIPEKESAEILQVLQKNRYVDDRRYARAFVRDKRVLAGWGERKIRFQLKLKKIPDEFVRDAFEECDAGEADRRMREIVAAKWRSLAKEEDCRRRRMKLLRFAMGRGYGYEEVSGYLEELESNINNIQ